MDYIRICLEHTGLVKNLDTIVRRITERLGNPYDILFQFNPNFSSLYEMDDVPTKVLEKTGRNPSLLILAERGRIPLERHLQRPTIGQTIWIYDRTVLHPFLTKGQEALAIEGTETFYAESLDELRIAEKGFIKVI